MVEKWQSSLFSFYLMFLIFVYIWCVYCTSLHFPLWNKVSLFTFASARLDAHELPGMACLCLSLCSRYLWITNVCYLIQLFMGSGDLNAGPYESMEMLYTLESPTPLDWFQLLIFSQSIFTFLWIKFLFLVVLRIEPRALNMPNMHSTAKLHSQSHTISLHY